MGPISGLGKEFDEAMKMLFTRHSHTKTSLVELKMISVMTTKLKTIIDEDGEYTRAEGYEEAIEDVKKVFKWAENRKDK